MRLSPGQFATFKSPPPALGGLAAIYCMSYKTSNYKPIYKAYIWGGGGDTWTTPSVSGKQVFIVNYKDKNTKNLTNTYKYTIYDINMCIVGLDLGGLYLKSCEH